MSLVIVDTHAVHWWSSESSKLSDTARATIEGADQLAVAAISWYELALMAKRERIVLSIPIRSWLEGLAKQVQTIGATPAIAEAAVRLPASFPRDPADRLIFATAIERGAKLVTKDRAIHDHGHPRSIAIW